MCTRERVIDPNPTVAPPPRTVERVINPDPLNEIPRKPIPIPTITFQADPNATAADRNAAAAANDAPETLGGIASRFSVPVGKQGYSKSLRPEAGRLVR